MVEIISMGSGRLNSKFNCGNTFMIPGVVSTGFNAEANHSKNNSPIVNSAKAKVPKKEKLRTRA